jgi:hypothetical protein
MWSCDFLVISKGLVNAICDYGLMVYNEGGNCSPFA